MISIARFQLFSTVTGILGCLVLFACGEKNSEESKSQSLFEVVPPDSSGLTFTNQIAESGLANVLSYQYFYNGGGVAVGDLNNDGLEDVFFTANQKPNALFLNKGNLKFRDITLATGTGGKANSWATGAAIVDINSDGLKDIYVCYSGDLDENSRRNELFVNQGLDSDGIPFFKEMASEFGLDDPAYSMAAYFSDLDQDGDLDMLLLNHNPSLFTNLNEQIFKSMLTATDPMSMSKIYRNEGDKYIDVTLESGLSGSPLSYGLGAVIADFNMDGFPDIYLGNDYSAPDYFYINQGDGTFQNQLAQAFSLTSQYTMGIDAADFDQDGWLDLISLDMLPEDNKRQKLLHSPENYEHYQLFVKSGLHHQHMRNMLQVNNQDGTFSEVGTLAGIEATDWSWAPLAADFDNDSWTDLFVSNGFLKDFTNLDFINYRNSQLSQGKVTPESLMDLIQKMPATKIGNYMYRNQGGLQFENVSQKWGLDQPGNSNGAIYADLDLDGDLDLLINNLNEPAQLIENKTEGSKANYLQVELKGQASNRDGIGAKVWLYSDTKTQFQEQVVYKGYQGNVSAILHFGLGAATPDSLRILWPDGKTEVISPMQSNQRIILEHEKAQSSTKARSQVATGWSKKNEWKIADLKEPVQDFKAQGQLLYSSANRLIHLAKGNWGHEASQTLFFSDADGTIWAIDESKQDFQQKKKVLEGTGLAVNELNVADLDGDGLDDIWVSYRDPSVGTLSRVGFQEKTGEFTLIEISNISENKWFINSLTPWDFDQDGDLDLLLGGGYKLGRWPESSESMVYENLGNRQFQLKESSVLKDIQRVNDMKVLDLTGNGASQVLIASEFAQPLLLSFDGTDFLLETIPGLMKDRGLWQSVFYEKKSDQSEVLILGNWGLNSRLQADKSHPLKLYFADFDKNGSVDPLMEMKIGEGVYPFFSRDELAAQLYKKKASFPDHTGYSEATMSTIITESEMKEAEILQVDTLATIAYHRVDGQWKSIQLPLELQYAPLDQLISLGSDQILALGNKENTRLKLGKLTANPGFIVEFDESGLLQKPQANLGMRGEVVDGVLLGKTLWVSDTHGKLYQFVYSENDSLN